MAADALRALLDPRSVAVLGASSDPGKAGGRPIHYMRTLGYAGQIYPVNPARTEIAGLPCYAEIGAVPGPIDLCIITLPTEQVEAALLACAAACVRAVVVFTSGFAEVGEEGRRRQERLADITRSSGIALCGPNCLGLINVASRAAATFTSALERVPRLQAGGLAFISQSGALAAFILAVMQDAEIGLSHFITTGNEACLGFADYATHLLDDPAVAVIAGYIEGADGPALVRVARRAIAAGKPLVLMKVGASAAGALASIAHTGKLGGNDAVYDAVFRQLGIVRAHTVDDLLDSANTLALAPRPRGRRLGVISISGGASVLMADWCERCGLQLASLAPETDRKLRAALPWFATAANPLDTTGRPLWDEGLFETVIAAIANDPAVDIVLVYVGIAPGAAGPRLAAEILRAAVAQPGKPLLVCWLPEPEPLAHRMLNAGKLPLFVEPVRMVKAAAALAFYADVSRRPDASPPAPAPPGTKLPPGEVISEHAAKQFLGDAGIPVTREALAGSEDEAVGHAAGMGGPVALKIVSPQIPHRTEIGAVRLGLRGEAEVRLAYRDIRAAALASVPGAHLEGVLVQEMVTAGCELIVSAFRDQVFGPVVLCGIGGVLVEVLGDTVIRLAPVSAADAETMLSELRGAPLLSGVRGAPALDISAAAMLIARLSEIIASTDPSVETIELNPVAVLSQGDGARALDALITRFRTEAA